MKARRASSVPGAVWAWVVVVSLVPAVIPNACPAETVMTPRVQARTEYDDNIRFTREDPADDLVMSLSPSVELSHRTERLQTNTSAAVRALRYWEESDLDREEILFDTDLLYGLSERVSIQGDASYRLDSALDSELRETGIVTEQVDRTRMSAGGGITFQRTELQELSGSVSLSQTEYDSDRFLDYDTAYAAVTWTRSFQNQRDGLTLQPYWSSNSSDASDVNTFGLMVGWTRLLTESWRLSAFVGARRTETEYQQVEQEVVFDPTLLPAFPFVIEERTTTREETGWGGVADVGLHWTNETWTFNGSYNRDLTYSSLGEPVERDRLAMSFRKRLDTRLTLHCRGTAILSQYEGITSSEDYQHFSLAPSISYRLTETHRLSAGFNYAYYENQLQEDSGRDRKRVWVSLDCTFPQIW